MSKKSNAARRRRDREEEIKNELSLKGEKLHFCSKCGNPYRGKCDKCK